MLEGISESKTEKMIYSYLIYKIILHGTGCQGIYSEVRWKDTVKDTNVEAQHCKRIRTIHYCHEYTNNEAICIVRYTPVSALYMATEISEGKWKLGAPTCAPSFLKYYFFQ